MTQVPVPTATYAVQHRVCTWNAGMRTLGKQVLQIQIEVFFAVATTAEFREDGSYNLAVLIAYQRAAKSITEDRIELNLFKTN